VAIRQALRRAADDSGLTREQLRDELRGLLSQLE
jgi:hypothetical protein